MKHCEGNSIKKLTVCICCLCFLVSGCVSLQTEEEISIKDTRKPAAREGIYHKVKKGETLWRISQVYNVSVKTITKANNIPKAAKIEKGQLVFIPGAKSIKTIALEVDANQKAFVWPVKGKVVKYFHSRYNNRINKGIDIKARVGDQVKASRAGKVVFADFLSGYGHTVILDHMDGFHSVYAKNSKLLVHLGERVMKNSAIAQVGHSHRLAYLHFQIRKDSVEDNPLYYLP